MNVYIDGVLQGGGGGGSLPDTPVAVLLDAASPNTFVALDGTGAGESLQPAAAQSLLELTTTLPLASSSGWTLSNGSGAVSITGGAARVQLGAGVVPGSFTNIPAIARPHGQSPFAVDVRARIKAWTGGDFTNVFAHFRVSNGTLGGQGFLLYVRGDGGDVGFLADSISGGGVISFGSQISSRAEVASGQFWTRIMIGPSGASAYYGVGVAGAQPTVWKAIASTTSTASWRSDWLSQVYVGLDSIFGGSGDAVTVDWDSFSASALGLP